MNPDQLRIELIDALRHPEELGVGFCPTCRDVMDAGDIEITTHAERLARLLEDRVIEIVVRVP